MLSTILGNIVMGISIVLDIITMQQKEKKKILFGFIIVNLTAIISYVFFKSYSAVFVCAIATVQNYIMHKYDKNKKKMPNVIQFIFIIVSIIGGIFISHNLLDIIPIIALILYTLSILQSKEKYIRLLKVTNILCWIIFDFYAKAYVSILFSLFTLTSTIIAIVRYDIKKGENKIERK